MIKVEGTETFRRGVLLASIIFAVFTLFILMGEYRKCEGSNLEIALWLAFSIHISTFLLLLFHYVGLGSLLMKLGRCLGVYYFYMVGAMFACQVVFFKSKGCSS